MCLSSCLRKENKHFVLALNLAHAFSFRVGAVGDIMDSTHNRSFTKGLRRLFKCMFRLPHSPRAEGVNCECGKEFLSLERT